MVENKACCSRPDQGCYTHGRIEISYNGTNLACAEQVGGDSRIKADATAIAHAEDQREQGQLDHA